MRVINLSHPIEADTPILPNYPSVEVMGRDGEGSIGENPHTRNAKLSIGLQVGTHIEAPFHFFEGKLTIDQVPLERCMGKATVVHLPERPAFSEITRQDLLPYKKQLRNTQRVLLYTDWYKRWKEGNYYTDHPILTQECAEFFLQCGVHLVGVDFPSVDTYPFPVHTALLGNEVLIIENIANFDFLSTDTIELVAIPLQIVGKGGSPVRALAIERDAND